MFCDSSFIYNAILNQVKYQLEKSNNTTQKFFVVAINIEFESEDEMMNESVAMEFLYNDGKKLLPQFDDIEKLTSSFSMQEDVVLLKINGTKYGEIYNIETQRDDQNAIEEEEEGEEGVIFVRKYKDLDEQNGDPKTTSKEGAPMPLRRNPKRKARTCNMKENLYLDDTDLLDGMEYVDKNYKIHTVSNS